VKSSRRQSKFSANAASVPRGWKTSPTAPASQKEQYSFTSQTKRNCSLPSRKESLALILAGCRAPRPSLTAPWQNLFQLSWRRRQKSAKAVCPQWSGCSSPSPAPSPTLPASGTMRLCQKFWRAWRPPLQGPRRAGRSGRAIHNSTRSRLSVPCCQRCSSGRCSMKPPPRFRICINWRCSTRTLSSMVC
jgi:hypothetical protein